MDKEKRDFLYKDIKQAKQGSIKFSREYKAKLVLKQVATTVFLVALILGISYLGYRITDNSVPGPNGRISYSEALKNAKKNDEIVLYQDKLINNDSFDFVNRILSHVGVQKTRTARIIATPYSMLLPDDKGNNIVLRKNQFLVADSDGARHIVEKSMIIGVIEKQD